ncbi:hypothetical protein [Aeromicrobium sp. NPDC092404]|uniref:hypothetical protein n=1 Tax=Aeromicrobium sp. NPDC092404 TaxID=3154976 RepID=UPI0034346824
MPPNFDLYVFVRTADKPAVLERFIDEYVDEDDPGDPRFAPFVRTFVHERPDPKDREELSELCRDEAARSAFSLYLRAKAHDWAIITLTEEADLVLGLSLDDSLQTPETEQEARALLAVLTEGFGALAGIAGVELAPPQSEDEWNEDALVLMRTGQI